jgi:subtilisin family serine protease
VEAALPTDSLQLLTAVADEPEIESFLRRHAGRRLSPVYPGLMRVKKAQGVSEQSAVGRVRQRFGARAERLREAFNPPELSRTYVLETDAGTGPGLEEQLARLRQDPDVEFAEEDKIAAAFLVPDDPYFRSTGSWGEPYDDLHGLKTMNVADAWDSTNGQGVVVAVVDTGIDYTHPELESSLWLSFDYPDNGVDDDINGYVDDYRGWDFVGAAAYQPVPDADPLDRHGHGTHVAGTIAARGNNGIGVVGVAWGAQVMAVKALDDDGYGYASGLAAAVVSREPR